MAARFTELRTLVGQPLKWVDTNWFPRGYDLRSDGKLALTYRPSKRRRRHLVCEGESPKGPWILEIRGRQGEDLIYRHAGGAPVEFRHQEGWRVHTQWSYDGPGRRIFTFRDGPTGAFTFGIAPDVPLVSLRKDFGADLPTFTVELAPAAHDIPELDAVCVVALYLTVLWIQAASG